MARHGTAVKAWIGKFWCGKAVMAWLRNARLGGAAKTAIPQPRACLSAHKPFGRAATDRSAAALGTLDTNYGTCA